MSTTAKARLQNLYTTLDSLFATVHPTDVPEMIAELRRDLTNRNNATRRSGYDRHTIAATQPA